MAFTILSTSGEIENLKFNYDETSSKSAKYYAGLKRVQDSAINVLTSTLVPDTSIAYENGSGWCSVTLGTTENNTGKSINVTCINNTDTTSRSCKIYLKYNTNKTAGYISVIQSGFEIPKDNITVYLMFKPGPYYTTSQVGTTSSLALRAQGYWTVDINEPQQYGTSISTSFFVQAAYPTQPYVTLQNYTLGTGHSSSKSIPQTHNWDRITIVKDKDNITEGPTVNVQGSNYTGGSLGTFSTPIVILRSECVQNGDNYSVVVEIKGTYGSPTLSYSIKNEYL